MKKYLLLATALLLVACGGKQQEKQELVPLKVGAMSSLDYVPPLATALLLVACGGKQQEKQELVPLKVGAMSSLDYVPYVLAQQLGYTDSLGVALEIVKFFSANDRDAAFRSGQVDGTVTDFTGAAIQHAAGLPLAIVTKHDGYFEMMAQPTIATLADLKGKQVSVSRNTVIEYATDKMLESIGLTPEEVEKPEINKIPIRMEMMVAEQVDASVFPDPFITISKAKGFVSLASSQELGFSVTGTIFSQQALEEKRDAIKALLEAYNLAVDYIQNHPREEWQEILVKDAGIPAELVQEVVLPKYTYAQPPKPADIEATIEWLKAKLLVPSDYTGEGLVYSDIY